MSGELAPITAATLEVSPFVDLDEWAARMEHAGKIARALAPTPFVPKSLRVYTRPEGSSRDEIDVGATTATVAAAVLTGTEIGLSPMGALRSIDVIEGTPALRAVALRALVLRAGHDIWVIESTSTRAIVSGIRAGTKHEQQSIWTIDRAKAASLTGKPNWQRHPAAMLVARATGEVARLIAPDVLLGLPYVVEELEDGAELDEPTIERPAEPPKRTAQRRRRPASTPAALPDLPPVEPVDLAEPDDLALSDPVENHATAEPELVEPELVEPELVDDEPAETLATEDQVRIVRRKLIAVTGLATSRAQVEYVSKLTGRPIEWLAELRASDIDPLLELIDADARAQDES